MSDATDLRAQLAELTRQARAWVEWLGDSGLSELPSEQAPAELLSALDAPVAGRGAARGGARPARPRQPSHPGNAGGAAARPQHSARPAVQANREQRGASGAVASAPPRAAAAGQAAFPRPANAEERKRRLEVLAQEVSTCTRCRLHESRTKTAFSRGNSETELVFVGEGPGQQEDQQGLPFVGKAGQLLDRMIVAMGYARDDVYICNIVKCRPPNNRKPEPDEMRACLPYLEEQLAIIDPKAIVTLGATGAQGLLNTSVGVTRMRGAWKLYRGRIPLMPTFHPAYLLRQPEKKREVWHDLQQVMKSLGKPLPNKSGR